MSPQRGYISIRTLTKKLTAAAVDDSSLAPALEWFTMNYPKPKNRKNPYCWGSGGGSFESHIRDEMDRAGNKDD